MTTETITIDAGTLYFSAEDNTASGLLVPYGVVARTNLGEFTAVSGSFEVPEDVTGFTLNTEHVREAPVGTMTKVWEQAEGLFASFQFSKSAEGQRAFMDAKDGKRKHLSVEATGVRIRDGIAIAGRIFGAALVGTPAFAGATLLAAENTPLEDDDLEAVRTAILRLPESMRDALIASLTETPETPEESDDSEEITETPTPETEEETMADAVIPNTLTASDAQAPTPLTTREVGNLLYASAQMTLDEAALKARLGSENGATLFAALSDVKYDGTGGLSSTMGIVPQWIGEVWQSVNYRQQVLPLFAHRDLTSLSMNGFKWTQKPAGGDWAGNKGAVPSNTLTVSAVTGTASRYAVGHDIAREFVDFGVPGFFESYAAAVGEDYAKWADNLVATAITAGATTLAADALTTLPGVTGGTIGSAASAIIDGATVLVSNGVLPSFALVAPALWKQMAKMPQSNVLGYLNASLGLNEGDLDGFIIRPSSAVATGKVLVGAKEAVTVFELPGAPIRIDALDLARGGIDKAAFGYAGVVINDARGLQLVTAATS